MYQKEKPEKQGAAAKSEKKKGGKAVRIKKMQDANKQTAKLRENNDNQLFGERSVK
ncbi:MAG TPA: hypothetical protein VHO46_08480 [Bacteroidales bacterium]|nr:hypothetical protein [Bacteroidales bacterium]